MYFNKLNVTFFNVLGEGASVDGTGEVEGDSVAGEELPPLDVLVTGLLEPLT